MKKIFWLMALALPMFVTTACQDDENEPEKKKEITRFTDGVEYLNAKLYYTDENGKVTGLTLGEFPRPSEPTTAYVGVDSQEEAQTLACSLFPSGAAFKVADNITFTLTDTLGVKVGQAHYTANTEGDSYGRLTFDNELGVDKTLLTSIVFIDNNLWPDNAPIRKSPLIEGNIYKCGKKILIQALNASFQYYEANFICTRIPKNGQCGILFADLNHSCYQVWHIDTRESGIERRITQYPSAAMMEELSKDLNGANDLYWQQIAACANTTVKTIKSRWYFTHHVDHGDQMVVCTLGSWSKYTVEVEWGGGDNDNYNASVLYKFTTNTDGTTNIKIDGAGCWTERQTDISLSDLSLNRDLMNVALTKNPNE